VRELSPADVRLQEEEVAALVRLDLDDVEALHEGAEVPVEEWTAGGTRPARTRLSDFVPEYDAYLLRVARVARQVLAGEGPERIF
jgi:hypothetical protein